MAFDPNDPGPSISPLQESVLGLLEDAAMPQTTCDAIMKLIDDAERDADAHAAQEQYERAAEK